MIFYELAIRSNLGKADRKQRFFRGNGYWLTIHSSGLLLQLYFANYVQSIQKIQFGAEILFEKLNTLVIKK